MAKATSAPKKKAPKTTQRWSLGLFRSAADGSPIVLYARRDGAVSKFYAKKVAAKQALAHDVFVGMSYAKARAALLAAAAKGNGKARQLLEAEKEVDTPSK